MTVIESILQGVQKLTLRQQVEIARHVYRLDTTAQKEREDILNRTFGSLDEVDGQAFEDALRTSRRIEEHG